MHILKIYTPKHSPAHNDVTWYDGLIAERDGHKLIATGEIRILRHDKDGNYLGMYDGKERDDFGIRLETDADLEVTRTSEEYAWDMNNWFEVQEPDGNTVLGDVAYEYDEAIELLKLYTNNHGN